MNELITEKNIHSKDQQDFKYKSMQFFNTLPKADPLNNHDLLDGSEESSTKYIEFIKKYRREMMGIDEIIH